MTREEAIKEIEKVFEPAFANYIVEALTKGATVSEKEPTTKNDLEVDAVSRKQAIKTIQRYGVGCFDADEFSPEECERFVISKLNELPSETPQEHIIDKIKQIVDRPIGNNAEEKAYNYMMIVKDIKEIIDKYKSESER